MIAIHQQRRIHLLPGEPLGAIRQYCRETQAVRGADHNGGSISTSWVHLLNQIAQNVVGRLQRTVRVKHVRLHGACVQAELRALRQPNHQKAEHDQGHKDFQQRKAGGGRRAH